LGDPGGRTTIISQWEAGPRTGNLGSNDLGGGSDGRIHLIRKPGGEESRVKKKLGKGGERKKDLCEEI